MDKIKSVSQFIEELIELTIDADDNSNLTFWFRGESNANFETSLVPNAYRNLLKNISILKSNKFFSKNIKSIEQNIDAEYYRKAFSYLKQLKVKNNLSNRYFLKQHYGIQTRLLDWSENALVALYFAVANDSKTDAKVFVLNPFELNNFTFKTILQSDKNCRYIPSLNSNYKKKELFNKDGEFRLREITRRYLKMDFSKDESIDDKSYFPLAIYPPYLDSRIQSQSSCFTIFGNEIDGLNNIGIDNILSHVIIDGNKKKNIIDELAILGINENTVYPGLDGLGKSIKNKFSLQYSDVWEILFHSMSEKNGLA